MIDHLSRVKFRFGMVPAQLKTLFDGCGKLWMSGALNNKFVGTFFGSGSMGAGQETTAFTTLPFFAHMGMIYVTIGGKHKSILFVKAKKETNGQFLLKKLTFSKA